MKLTLPRILVALLTFIIGVALVFSYQTISQYRVRVTQEAELRKELFQMRRSIDQYVAEKGSAPESLNSLVEAGCLQGIPVDPITGNRNWQEKSIWVCECVCVPELLNVNSSSAAISLSGTPYSKW